VVCIGLLLLLNCLIQCIYNYILEANHGARIYSVAAVLYLQFLLHVMLFDRLNTFCTFTSVRYEVCVWCLVWLFLWFLYFVFYVAQVVSE
jgi:hypothetical protein